MTPYEIQQAPLRKSHTKHDTGIKELSVIRTFQKSVRLRAVSLFS